MEIVHSIESERISMEKARMENDNIASWSSLWNDERENYLQMSSPELQKTLTDLIKECDLMKKALKERQDFGKIGDNISKEIDEYYKNDSKGAEKRNFLKNAESDDINALLAVCQKRASNIQEIIQKQSGESQNTKRSSFIAVQYQKIDAILKESEKDPKFNALKEIDDLREGHKDIPRELIDNAYKVFDVEKYSERKAAINEFIETGNVKEQQEKRSISIDAVKSDFKSSYQEGSPEGVACKVGISSLSNAVEYNKHLFGVIERIEKPVEKTPELGGVSMEEKTDNKHLAALQQSQKEGIGGGRGQS